MLLLLGQEVPHELIGSVECSVWLAECLIAGPCRALMASSAVPHLLVQGLQSSGKPALAIARRRVISSPEQIWVAEVHLHRLAGFLCWGPLPYHPACSSEAHVSQHCMCTGQMLGVVASDSLDCFSVAAYSTWLAEMGSAAV